MTISAVYTGQLAQVRRAIELGRMLVMHYYISKKTQCHKPQ